ncbi:MAG: ABC transporter ATP-binding protein [Sphaerochaetaceae bacterium]|nr:ABC transporter ATP-binding protein [Sphaerochaetaceae bacterium]
MKISIEHLTKRFGSTTAVNDLSFEIESGKLIALLGPSGCGKSTILNMLSGIIPATEGKILFDGKDVTDLPPEKRNVGLVFQNYALYPHMSVLENIAFPLEIKKVPRKQRNERARELAELVKIGDLVERKPSELSGGQQQRVAIARALAKDPALLLLDEPLSNLDAKLRVEMREEILRIQRASQVTTVFVTHDQEEASSIADQVVLLRLGVMQQQDSPRRIYDQPANFFTADFLGAPPINKLYGKMKSGRFCLDNSLMECQLPLRRQVADGTAAILAARSESVMLSEKGAIQARVLERYSINKDELTIFDIDGQRCRGFIPGDVALSAGDAVRLAFKNRGVFLFDEATGERLS